MGHPDGAGGTRLEPFLCPVLAESIGSIHAFAKPNFPVTSFHLPCRPRISSVSFQMGVFCSHTSMMEVLISP